MASSTYRRHRKIIWLIIIIAIATFIPLSVSAVQNIFMGSQKMVDFQLGSQPVSKVYLGGSLVWERGSSVVIAPEGYVPPSNITNTNPAVLDVYPTTGWAGDIIAITGNAMFTGVTDVTVGGTTCTSFEVVSSSLIMCVLPAQASGTTNPVAVLSGGTSLFSASAYDNMKITYFDPSSPTVSIAGVTYSYYHNIFTAANCAAMPATNTAGTGSPASIAYVRDARNSQTYRVKKMVDNKCWMVDNLKYIDSAVENTSDGTTGMVYNQGDHLGNGATTAYNTANETATQGNTNSNKAFYNNPMHLDYCRTASANMPARSLTKCGYFYNWYAATAGTGKYASYAAGTQASGSICPANFRLPSIVIGTSYSDADFTVLNTSMNAGTLANGAIGNYFAGWRHSGVWEGVYPGNYSNSFTTPGSMGAYWSSTIVSPPSAYYLRLTPTTITVNANNSKTGGMAVRCVMP